ncbi:MAG: orotidine-5'-phosphate decarboxylase [Firmicutes bacterium]|nr:orotidine-5'-phosphate decarboxylase [Bacillota bacterium]
MFINRLEKEILAKKSPLVVGLDPDLTMFPPSLKPAATASRTEIAAAILAFNKSIIDQVADLVPAVKPQAAFYEEYGWAGIKALEETAVYARSKGLLVILDAKRGDVPNTASAYARAYLAQDENPHAFPCDALTINPFLGRDSLQPFIDAASSNQRGIFLLVRTSNRGAADLQNLRIEGAKHPLWQEIAGWVADWATKTRGANKYSPVGIVAGLTYPQEAQSLRLLLPHSYLLLPGLGTQGGQVADAIPCFDPDGLGALLIAARSIIYAYLREPYINRFSGPEFAQAARQAAADILQRLYDAGYRRE